MGDFWGIEDFHPDFDDHKGCSLAIIHNEKAEALMKGLKDTEVLEVSLDEIINKQGNAFAPSKPHVRRNEFWKDYAANGFSYLLPKYFNCSMIGRFKAEVKYILFKLHLRRYSY